MLQDIDSEINEPKLSVNTRGWSAGSSDLTDQLLLAEGPFLHLSSSTTHSLDALAASTEQWELLKVVARLVN